MSSKRRLRRRSCGSKVRHKTAEFALLALRHTRGRDLNVYHCKFCGGYHVGHMPAWIRAKIRGRLESRPAPKPTI